MKLGALFHGIPVLEKIHWDPNRTVRKITSDSRALEDGDVFVACRGARMDGHDFIGQAIMAKAGVIVFEQMPELTIPSWVTAVCVSNSHACLTEMLIRFHDHPDRKIKLAGVTGTNGKTTIAYLLHQLLREKTTSSYLGTLWYELPNQKLPAPNTTPGPEVLIPLLGQMADQKVTHCAMEVSSHALEQERIHGLKFEVGIFTQLTQDHLDYHKDMERYFEAKKRFFSGTMHPRQMLINRDCVYGQRLLYEFPHAKSYSVKEHADYQAKGIEPSFQGSRFKLCFKGREVSFQIRLPMLHNVINTVTALGCLDMMGFDPEDFRGALQEIAGIPGRMERVGNQLDYQIFVDYAHTPDAIKNVLSETRKLGPNRILTLFGCGGDRDQTKRPLMAEAACAYSDVIILTSDNPRTEDPETILEDIKKGIPTHLSEPPEIHEILDRREAIEKIISLAEPGDVVLVLGKGHEDYQILGERKIPFDDRMVIQECLKRNSRVFFS